MKQMKKIESEKRDNFNQEIVSLSKIIEGIKKQMEMLKPRNTISEI